MKNFEELLDSFIQTFVGCAKEYDKTPSSNNKQQILDAAEGLHVLNQAKTIFEECGLEVTLTRKKK